MNKYENSFYLFDGDAKQIPIIPMHGAPTEDTEGVVGLILMDVDAPGCPMYKCVEVTEEGNSVWEPFVDRALYEKDVFQAYGMGYGDGVDDEHNAMFKSVTDWSSFNVAGKRQSIVDRLRFEDTSNGTNFHSMFMDCADVQSIPLLDTSRGTVFSQMFRMCKNLKNDPKLNTENATTLENMFAFCENLQNISQLNTKNAKNMSNIFSNCKSLSSVPEIDMQSATTVTQMFSSCQKLTHIKLKNMSECPATDLSRLFSGCTNLTTIEGLDTSKGTNFSGMFMSTVSMATYPEIDTSNGTVFEYMFRTYSNTGSVLKTLPKINISKATNINSMFTNESGGSSFFESITFEGSININGLNLSHQTKLSHDSLMSMINALADKTGDTSTTWKVTIGSTNLAKLTAAEKQIAVDKNWTLA